MTSPDSAPAAPKYTPFVTDVTRLGRVLFSPGEVFGELQERPTFWMPWLVISIVYTVLQFLQQPFQARVREIMLEAANRPVPPQSSLAAMIGLVTSPLTVLVLCALSAAVMFGLMAGLGGETTYKKMLTVVIFTWPLVLLQQALTVVVLTIRGVGSINTAMDMMVSTGVDLLLPADTTVGYFTRFVLAGIGPVQIWSLAITAVGLMVLGKAGKTQAWVAATVYYVVVLVCLSALGAFGMKFMGG
jgi:hypothetical protein